MLFISSLQEFDNQHFEISLQNNVCKGMVFLGNFISAFLLLVSVPSIIILGVRARGIQKYMLMF